jgi:tetratricopeptide (TPR) repeat protein
VKAVNRIASILCIASILSCAHTPTAEEQEEASFLYESGVSLFRDGRYPESIKSIEDALKLTPDRPDYMLTLGLAYMKSERYAEARTWSDRACATGKLPTECAVQQATVALVQGYPAEALPWANKAVADATYPSPAEALLLQGRALYSLNRRPEAEKSFQTAVTRAPSDCYPRLLLSRSFLARAAFAPANREAAIARSLCNTNERAHEWEAYVFYKTGRIAEAKKKYRRIMTLFKKGEIVERNRQALAKLTNERPLEEPSL